MSYPANSVVIHFCFGIFTLFCDCVFKSQPPPVSLGKNGALLPHGRHDFCICVPRSQHGAGKVRVSRDVCQVSAPSCQPHPHFPSARHLGGRLWDVWDSPHCRPFPLPIQESSFYWEHVPCGSNEVNVAHGVKRDPPTWAEFPHFYGPGLVS